jgi:O-antigen/teichoic acid export membrane protein
VYLDRTAISKGNYPVTPERRPQAQTIDGSVAVHRAFVARGTAQNLLSRACVFAVGYLATIILARALGPAHYGVYGLIMSVLLWIEQTSRFTISPAAAILIPRGNHSAAALQQTALFLNLGLFLLLFVLLWCAAPFLADLFGLYDGADLFRVAALDLPFFGMYAVYYGVLQGRRDFLSIGIADVIYSSIKLAGILLLLGFWLSVPGALVINAVASAGVLVFLVTRVRISSLRPNYSLIRPFMRVALPLGLYMLALQTTANLDLWFLKRLNPGAEATIGMYVAARSVAMAPGVILMVVSDVLLPSLSHALGKNDVAAARRYLQGGVRLLCIVGLPIVLLVTLTAQEIMVLLYSSSFREGASYLPLLILYSLSLPFIDLFAASLSAHGQPLLGGITLSLVIPIAVVLDIGFILAYGPIGAAYASAVTGLLGVFALGLLVYRRFGSLIASRTLFNVTVAIVMMSAAVTQVTLTGAWLAIVAAGCLILYTGGLVGLGEVTWKDVEPLAFWRSLKHDS